MLDTFPPVTLTVSSFFKQEGDKLRDDDLYKFLQDLKRPSPVLKRLKCIRGSLKLDISVAPEPLKHCLTPELAKLIPFPDLKTRPTKEILEFHSKEPLIANYQFRNLLYVCPKDLNFTNRQGERARNIAVKVQFRDGLKNLKVLSGKSSCPEMMDEVCSAVTYHNKSPDFYEEVKVKLPSNLREQHHLLFTFYHISCQGQRKDQQSTELIVGYSWIPIIKDGSSLQVSRFSCGISATIVGRLVNSTRFIFTQKSNVEKYFFYIFHGFKNHEIWISKFNFLCQKTTYFSFQSINFRDSLKKSNLNF